jgi:hypothetical protein
MRHAALLLCVLLGLPAVAQPALDFVQITDTHVADFEGVHTGVIVQRLQNQLAATSLRTFLKDLRAAPPAFLLHTGDAIDAVCLDGPKLEPVCGQIDVFRSIMRESPAPVYLALGNHDIERYRWSGTPPKATGDQSIAAEARREWSRAVPALSERSYYSFRKKVAGTSYRFIVLDNGESGAAGAAFAKAQLEWLQREIDSHRKEWIVLALHVPLGAGAFSDGVKAAAARTDRVVLAIAGHRHSNALEEIDLGTRRLLQVRTASLALNPTNARRFRLLRDRIEISETGQPGTIVKTVSLTRQVQ